MCARKHICMLVHAADVCVGVINAQYTQAYIHTYIHMHSFLPRLNSCCHCSSICHTQKIHPRLERHTHSMDIMLTQPYSRPSPVLSVTPSFVFRRSSHQVGKRVVHWAACTREGSLNQSKTKTAWAYMHVLANHMYMTIVSSGK